MKSIISDGGDPTKGENRDGWGPWRHDDGWLVGPFGYEIPLSDCSDAARTLDWIYQVVGNTRDDDEALAGLVRALSVLAGHRV